MTPNVREAKIIGFTRVFSAFMAFLIHVLFFERLTSIVNSDLFDFAVRKTGALAWVLFVGIPFLVSISWGWKISWPITSQRRKGLFVLVLLSCHVLPIALGVLISIKGLWRS